MPWRRPSERTEIVHIVATGCMRKKYPRKHYVFVVDVTWNNSDRFEVYRRYSDFFSFQATLKALFPVAAGRRNEERVIPALPKRIFVGRSHVERVAEARLEHINRYCQNLISLEPKVSESAHVIGFFTPRIGDKQLPKLHLHRPASLHPQTIPAGSLFEEYIALAEYEAEDESQISFKSGDKILVVSKDDSGWWLCQREDKVGWVPPSYLKKCCAESDSDSEEDYLGLPEDYCDSCKEKGRKDNSDDSGTGSQSEVTASDTSPAMSPVDPKRGFNVPKFDAEEYRAIDSYEAEGPGQVSFEEGEVILVLDKIEDGWWFVSKGSGEGWAPCSYLESLEGDKEDDTISSLDIEKYSTVDIYTAEENDEISFPKGVAVDVLQKSLNGWWLIKYEGKNGLAPATYLKKLEQTETPPGFTRKITPPPQTPNFQITKPFQQPPRKESVRIRVSKKKLRAAKERHGKSPLSHTPQNAKLPLSHTLQSAKLPLSHTPQNAKLPLSHTTQNGKFPLSHPAQNGKFPLSHPAQNGKFPLSHAAQNGKFPLSHPVQKFPLSHAAQNGKFPLSSVTRAGIIKGPLPKQPEKPAAPEANSPDDEDSDEHSYENIADFTLLRLGDKDEQEAKPKLPPRPVSPHSSDSEDASSQPPKSQRGLKRNIENKIHKFEYRSGSESSLSEDGSAGPFVFFRPQVVTRTRPPMVKPKPHFLKSKLLDDVDGPEVRRHKQKNPAELHRPPRPRGTEIRRAHQVPQIREEPPTDQPKSLHPPRPRGSEIKRAHEKGSQLPPSDKSAFRPVSPHHSPTPSPTPSPIFRTRSPLGALREESGEESDTSISSRRNQLKLPVEKTRSLSATVDPPVPPPFIPQRARRVSESAASPSNPFNQQMADVLIKYILASKDPGLRSALRDIVTSDPDVMKVLTE